MEPQSREAASPRLVTVPSWRVLPQVNSRLPGLKYGTEGPMGLGIYLQLGLLDPTASMEKIGATTHFLHNPCSIYFSMVVLAIGSNCMRLVLGTINGLVSMGFLWALLMGAPLTLWWSVLWPLRCIWYVICMCCGPGEGPRLGAHRQTLGSLGSHGAPK